MTDEIILPKTIRQCRKSDNAVYFTSCKTKRIFVDAPSTFSGITFGEPIQAEFERTVVSSDFFAPALSTGRIVVQHNCWVRPPMENVNSHLVLARIAGYREAVYGLPDTVIPLLFEHPENPDILISSSKLSSYAEGRFCPKCDWQVIIGRIMAWLNGNLGIEPVHWEASVRPSYGENDNLPDNALETSFKRCATWFTDNMFFRHTVGTGVFEGYDSNIAPNGRQSLRPKARGDGTGEASMIPALDWALHRDYASRQRGLEILKNLFMSPELADNCPQSPAYGGVNFYEHVKAFYGDDNCRAFMCAILTSELTGNFDYVEPILRGMMMVLRTCGTKGFRRGRLDVPESFANDTHWSDYYREPYVQFSPHRQAYMWAGFLQAYALTGYREFYDKAATAIRMTMNVFPRLEWTNGITQEYARMLLPLAFLVELDNTSEYRGWLKTASEALLENMDACGAIREMMGDLADGKYPSPASNAEYGSTEASLIQNNGDPACDLVYTMNYAYIGLYEAMVATGDAYYKKAVDKLTDFFCRIQVRSDAHSYLDGCWMRGFDYKLWEFYGSSADNGWGAWCVESGWTNSWIGGTMGLMQLGRGVLCKESAQEYRSRFPRILREMMDTTVKLDLCAAQTGIRAPGAE